jgi:hypothetical protein
MVLRTMSVARNALTVEYNECCLQNTRLDMRRVCVASSVQPSITPWRKRIRAVLRLVRSTHLHERRKSRYEVQHLPNSGAFRSALPPKWGESLRLFGEVPHCLDVAFQS